MKDQTTKLNILGIAGSIRKGSYNRALIKNLQAIVPADVNLIPVRIDNLPLFNQDQETDFPKEATDLKSMIRSADGIIIATPEYNRGIPGVLKNAIDWSSRPHGDNPWDGKVVMVIGATPGSIGTAIGQSHLKQSLLYLNAQVIGQPEFYLSGASEKFNSEGILIDDKTKEFLKKALDAFVQKVIEKRG
ncbi:MAG: NADPH-dependent FMN reductase [Patescibacteria group bacterium]